MIASEVLPQGDLETLLAHRAEWCVSIFLPTHRIGTDAEQDGIRLKNLLRQAEDGLTQAGMRRTLAKDLLQRAADLVPDVEFWQHQQDGLAVFVSPELFRQYRLPLALPELATVSDRFEVKPLLPLITGNGRYYVLALSQKRHRLLRATRFSVEVVDTPAAPASIDDVLRFIDAERQLQFHSRSGGARTGGRRAAIYHGQGVGVDDAKDHVLRYCQLVDRGLHQVLRDEKAPLVLAAVEYEQAIYRDANTYPHLLADGIAGNPDARSADDLARNAWPIVEPQFRAARQTAVDRFHALQSAGRSSTDLGEILPASAQGRIDTLFAARGVQVWGRFSPDSLELVPSPDGRKQGDHDLLDEAARYTLTRGGTVYVVDRAEMPVPTDAAAIFRF